MKKIRLLNGTILKEGKKYNWGGHTESLYTSYTWHSDKCKIVKISDEFITIYDYDEDAEYDYTIKQLAEIQATFKRRIL